MLIESLFPIFKDTLTYVKGEASRRVNARALYERTGNLGERFLLPVGRDEYDLFTLVHIPDLDGEKGSLEIRQIAGMVDPPVEALLHGEKLRNRVYFFVVDHFTQGYFIKSFSRVSGKNRFYYVFYSLDMGDRQIISRIRTWIGQHYAWRARDLRAALEDMKVQAYGQLSRLLLLWDSWAQVLREIGHRYFERWRAHPERQAFRKREDLGLAERSARALLDVTRSDLPRVYPLLRGMIAVYYPELVKGPHGWPFKGTQT